MALLEQMMLRQTRRPDEWIVADGGEPVGLMMGQTVIREKREPGPLNFANNLLNALGEASGDLVIVMEDDDWYAPTHIESMVQAAKGYGLIGSEQVQRYYNVAHRCYRIFNNIGASLCQTAVRSNLLPVFRQAIQTCIVKSSIGVDAALWRSVRSNEWAFTRQMTVVGVKGLPGRMGLGVGHRPDARWTADPELAKLRQWIGSDTDNYIRFTAEQEG